MGKTPKNNKSKKKETTTKTKLEYIIGTKKISKTAYQRYINSIPITKNKITIIKDNMDNYIEKIKDIFQLLFNYFSKNKNISSKSLNTLINITKNANDELFANFQNLLNPEEFYQCFISYLKKNIKENILKQIKSGNFVTRFYSVFQKLKNENIEIYLFEKEITSYIRQDIVLSIFKLGSNLDSYVNLLNLGSDWFEMIDKNNLILDESIETFEQNYLLSECVFHSIKTTLSEFIKIDDEALKKAIHTVLNKINFYYSELDEQFSAITFLGYNVVIRNYFKNYKNQDVKVALSNVITHELIHILLIELTDKNFFNNSFERSNKKIIESGNYFEKIFFGVDVQWYSKDLVDYLKNFENFKKDIKVFNNDIINIYNNSCIPQEDTIMTMTDDECIKSGILRNKMNFKKNNDYKQFGHCYKYFLINNYK